MSQSTSIINFFVPYEEIVQDLPSNCYNYWQWILAWLEKNNPKILWDGPFSWTLQSFLYLRESGFPCNIVHRLPDQGIVISHSDFIPWNLSYSSERYIVEIKPDRKLKCRQAQAVIVQNRNDPLCRGLGRLLYQSYFVDYWPQPGLLPRNSDRMGKFQNIAYVGNVLEMSEELEEMFSRLQELDLAWKIIPRNLWHDYREIDAIVAVRGGASSHLISSKPAAKLYNSWHAHIPAILSPDCAYEDIRKSDLDYLVARNADEVFNQLKRLKENPQLRKAMIENGHRRARDFTIEKITLEWREVLEDLIIPDYLSLQNSLLRKFMSQFIRLPARKVFSKLLKV